MKRSLRRFKNTRGFTLVELVVVLVLVSIVSAIAIPSYLGYVDDTHEKQCEMNMKRLASYLDDMRVTSSSADMTDVLAAHPEIQCPSGGTYYVPDAGSAAAEDGSADKGAASVVKCDKHSDLELVVATRDGGLVTADAKPGSGTTEEPAPPATEEKKPENNAGSGSGSETEAQPTLTVTVSPNPQTIEVGQKCTLTANFDVTGGAADDSTIQWTSDNPSVAVVTGDGSRAAEITASAAGTYQITCTATAFSPNKTQQKSGSGNATVTVNKQKIDGVKLNVTPSSVTLGRGETTQLKAVVDPAVSCTYQWVCTNGSGVSIVSGQDTNTLTVKGDTAGASAVFTCTAIPNDPVKEVTNASLTADATVTVKKDPVTLNLSINPSSVTVNEGGTVTLTANLSGGSVTGCTYKWTSSDPSAVELMENNTQSVTVKGVKKSEGPVNITCTAVPTVDSSMELQNGPEIKAGAQVRVEENITSTADDILVKGWDTDTINATLNPADYGWETGGTWESSELSLKFQNNGYVVITDNKTGGRYKASYTVDGATYEFYIRVVYPIYSFYMQTITWGADNHTLNINTQEEIYVTFGPEFTTEESSIQWYVEGDKSVVGLESTNGTIDGDKCRNKITANKEGVVKVHAVANREISHVKEVQEQDACVEITVVDPDKLSSIKVDAMRLKTGEEKRISDIGVQKEPPTANMEGVIYQYSSNDPCINVDDDAGVIKALEEGTATVRVDAVKNGEVLASCEFTVVVSDLNRIWIDEQTITVNVDETKQFLVQHEPVTANMTGIEYSVSGSGNGWNAAVSIDNAGQLKIEGKHAGDEYVAVRMSRNGVILAEINNVHIKVEGASNNTEITGIIVEPNAVTLREGQSMKIAKIDDDPNADIVISSATGESLSDYQIGYSMDWNSGVAYCNNGIITPGNKAGTIVLEITATNPYQQYKCNLEINVLITPKVQINGTNFILTTWDELREYIRKKTMDASVENLSPSALFQDGSGNLYILKQSVALTWNDDYQNMTFDQFCKENADMFYRVDTNVEQLPQGFTDWGDKMLNFSAGKVAYRQDKFYVAIRDVQNENFKTWDEDIFNSTFVELQKAN